MDFLLAIKDTHTAFYSYWAGEIERTETAPTLPDLINKFRQRMRNEATGSPAALGAFPASFQGLSTGSTGSDSPVPSSTQKKRGTLSVSVAFLIDIPVAITFMSLSDRPTGSQTQTSKSQLTSASRMTKG
jgi:hypothetical protein